MKFVESFEEYSQLCKLSNEEPTKEKYEELLNDIEELRNLIVPNTLTDFITHQLLLGVQYDSIDDAKIDFG